MLQLSNVAAIGNDFSTTSKESEEATVEARCGGCKKSEAQEAMQALPALRETIMKGLGVEEVASLRYRWTKTNKADRVALL
jgi:hypothetical protein